MGLMRRIRGILWGSNVNAVGPISVKLCNTVAWVDHAIALFCYYDRKANRITGVSELPVTRPPRVASLFVLEFQHPHPSIIAK